ncbi:MAG: hypothetical protein CUN52_03000 [Phototrophicales bacterium]|nr:MAG: hypothetical protein CUN52_03000 [Phototrophicales bacterium]
MSKRLMICLLLLLITIPIRGQESPTPTPTPSRPVATSTPRPDVPDYIYDWREEVLYPVAVYFFLVIDRPLTAIQDVRLVMIVADEATPRILEFADVQPAATVTSPFTEFNLVWRVPPDNPLPLNAQVEYEWQVRLSETETTSVTGVFAYQHPNITWILDRDPQNRLDLLMPQLHNLTPTIVRQRINPIIDRLSQNTGTSQRFRFLLENPDYVFDPCTNQRTITSRDNKIDVPCDVSILNNLLTRLGYTRLTSQTTLLDRIIPTIAEAFYAPLWVNSDFPEWFKQGILLMYAPGDKQYFLDAVKSASRTNTLFTLEQMNTFDEARAVLWRSQSYVMTLYMAQRIGFPALFDIARNDTTTASIPFLQRYQNAMNASLDALLPTINNWIFTIQATSAASVTIYGDPTPFPSATPSETPFPPTPTDTPTNTATPTPTPTVTGVLTATPIPSRTPTNTVVVTPSITPRPAGFRDPAPPLPTLPRTEQPTPFPSIEGDIQATTDSGVLVSVVLGLALIGLSVLFLIYWWTERKSS